MALSLLSQASAFNPGSDLWILPDLEKSPWTAKLDWYLNFQICKASLRQAPSLPEFLNEVVEKTELGLPPLPAPAPSLMIASSSLLPNKWVVLVPWENNLETWTQQAVQTWAQLQEPSLRIFLPPGQSAGSFELAWQKHHSFQDFTVVLD